MRNYLDLPNSVRVESDRFIPLNSYEFTIKNFIMDGEPKLCQILHFSLIQPTDSTVISTDSQRHLATVFGPCPRLSTSRVI